MFELESFPNPAIYTLQHHYGKEVTIPGEFKKLTT